MAEKTLFCGPGWRGRGEGENIKFSVVVKGGNRKFWKTALGETDVFSIYFSNSSSPTPVGNK